MLSRFVKMAVLQYARCIRLGYSKEMAKAIGYAQALKYAIFKSRKPILQASSPDKKKVKLHRHSTTEREIVKDSKFQLYFDEITRWPYVGNRLITDFEMDKELMKYTDDEKKRLVIWAFSLIDNQPREVLENERKFYELVWKPHRDDQIV